MPFYITFHDFTHGQLDKALKPRSDLKVYMKGALELKNFVIRPGGAAKTRFGTDFLFESEVVPGTPADDGHFYEPDPFAIPNIPPLSPGYQMFDFSPNEHVKLLIILGAKSGPDAGLSNIFQFYIVRNDLTPANEGEIHTVTSTAPNIFEISTVQVARIKYRVAQNQTTMVLVTGEHPPLVLTWTGTTITAKNLVFRNYPQHDFTRNGYIKSTFGIKTGWVAPTYLKVTPPGATLLDDLNDDYPALAIGTLDQTAIPPLDTAFRGFYYDGDSGDPTLNPDSHYVGGIIEMAGPVDDPTAPIGYAQIISTTEPSHGPNFPACSNLVCRIRVMTPIDISWRVTAISHPFPVNEGVLGDQCVLTEPAFSSVETGTSFPGRGDPRTVSFYESRLCLAGSRNLPQSIFMSAIGNFEDFSTGTGEPAEAIAYTIASGAEDQIINMIAGRSLQIFTTTNEFSAPVWSEQGLTPSTVTIRRQTSIGSSNCIPVILDNMTLYAKRGGKGVMAFESANTGGNTYNSEDQSVYSSELINNPIHMTAYVENEAYDANIAFVINKPKVGDPGNMVMFESLKEQEVAAWTTTETQGEFLNIESVGDSVFMVVQRGVEPGTPPRKLYILEEMNWNICMDGAIKYTATTPGVQPPPSPPLPKYLWGKAVEIVGWVGDDPQHPQGVWIGEYTIGPAGEFTPDIPVWEPASLPTFDYWIGLKFEQRLETMPVDIQTKMGNMLFLRKKIYKCYVQYLESYPFFVNGVETDLRSLGFETGQWPPGTQPGIGLNEAELPYSGIWMRPTMQKLNLPAGSGPAYRGFIREATVLITLDRPLPLNIQGITAATS